MKQIRKIDFLEFIPQKVICGKGGEQHPLSVNSDDCYIMLSYVTNMTNNAKREFSLTIPKYITRNQETFEVLGLLQAEMGKTENRCLVFANSEHKIINKVIKWFEKELEINPNNWKWYIKLNIKKPENKTYRREIETKIVNYWLRRVKIDPEKRYPTTITYRKESKRRKLKNHGTLIIEYKSNLFSQIIKRYVHLMSKKIPSLGKEEIRWFMKGIIAGESNIEIYKPAKIYRVYLSAIKKEELDLYQKCLNILEIDTKQYQNDKLIISKRKNNIELLKQKLVCLSPKKYDKFLKLMKLYPKISEETGYFSGKKEPHNKISQEITNKIVELHHKNPDAPAWKIAEKVGVSAIKVARVRKEHSLGERRDKTSKEMIEKIIKLHQENPSAYAYEIANKLGLHKSRIERVRRKYGLVRTKKQ